MRLEEFYESPFENINGKFFTVEEYIDTHVEKFKRFNYYSKWTGFNIPGEVVRKFFDVFKLDLWNKEKRLMEILGNLLISNNRFYLVATYKTGDIRHEVAHGYYYFDEEYKQRMDYIADKSPTAARFKKALLADGYRQEGLNDEVQAYLATSPKGYLRKTFKLPEKFKIPKGFGRIFDKKHALKP
jgi:hypothetical protein